MKTNKIFIFVLTLLLISCSKDEKSEVIDVLFFQTIDENTVLPTTGLYDSIKHNQKQVYIYDDFSQDTGFWSEYSTSGINYFNAFRQDGLYRLSRGGSAYSPSEISFSKAINNISDTDFEIEYKLKEISSGDGRFSEDYVAGFIWGKSFLSDTAYYFFKEYYSKVDYKYQHFISIGKVENNESTVWFKVRVSSFQIFKKFTIRKMHNRYYFFIDEEFIGEHEFMTFFGNTIKIGFTVGQDTDFYIDNFVINYLVNLEK